MWGEGTRYEFLPGPHVSPLRAGPPQKKKRLPGAEGPPEGKYDLRRSSPWLQGLHIMTELLKKYGRACEVYFRSGVLCCHEGPSPAESTLAVSRILSGHSGRAAPGPSFLHRRRPHGDRKTIDLGCRRSAADARSCAPSSTRSGGHVQNFSNSGRKQNEWTR